MYFSKMSLFQYCVGNKKKNNIRETILMELNFFPVEASVPRGIATLYIKCEFYSRENDSMTLQNFWLYKRDLVDKTICSFTVTNVSFIRFADIEIMNHMKLKYNISIIILYCRSCNLLLLNVQTSRKRTQCKL